MPKLNIKYGVNFNKGDLSNNNNLYIYIKDNNKKDWPKTPNSIYINDPPTKDTLDRFLKQKLQKMFNNKELDKYIESNKEIIIHSNLNSLASTDRNTFFNFKQIINEIKKEFDKKTGTAGPGTAGPGTAGPGTAGPGTAAPTSVAPTTPGRSVRSKNDCNSDEFFHHDSKECRKCPDGERPNKKKNKCVPDPRTKTVDPHKNHQGNNRRTRKRNNQNNHKRNSKGNNKRITCYKTSDCKRIDLRCDHKTNRCVNIKKDKEKRYKSAMRNSNQGSVGLLTRMRKSIEDAELLCGLCKKNETYIKTGLFQSGRYAITRRFINRLKVAEQECKGCLRKCHFLKKNTKKSTLKDKDIFKARYPKLCKGDSSSQVKAIQIKKGLRKKLLEQYKKINK